MRKIFLVFALFLATILSANAQEISDNVIGLRLTNNNGFSSEISYQRKLKEHTRLEINLSTRDGFRDLKLVGLHEWVWSLEENFNWYAGFGSGICEASGTSIFASGIIGVEYQFKIPLLLSLDYRPEVRLIGNVDTVNSNLGLSIRYQL
jgi:hypothetical protein